MMQTQVVQAVGVTPEFLSAYIIFNKFPKPFELFPLLERKHSKLELLRKWYAARTLHRKITNPRIGRSCLNKSKN